MIPKRVSERLVRTVPKYQEILRTATDHDVTESNTVFIIRDILAEVFGYDKLSDITSEYSIRGTRCDLAIKVDDRIEFLLEAKAIGLTIILSRLRTTEANHGVPWIILTNGMLWRVYKIRFEQPISYDFVCDFDFSSWTRATRNTRTCCSFSVRKD